ncbi:MAG: hypothetical protein ACLU30_09945 [Odoribacter splanchnicus]
MRMLRVGNRWADTDAAAVTLVRRYLSEHVPGTVEEGDGDTRPRQRTDVRKDVQLPAFGA